MQEHIKTNHGTEGTFEEVMVPIEPEANEIVQFKVKEDFGQRAKLNNVQITAKELRKISAEEAREARKTKNHQVKTKEKVETKYDYSVSQN